MNIQNELTIAMHEYGILRAGTKDASVYRNATILLRTADGQPKQVLAEALGCSTATIDRIRRRYRTGGTAALVPTKPPGRPSRASAEYRAELERAVRTPPQSLGYGFSTWSAARLAQHLKKVTGIALGVDQVRRILRRSRYSVQRPKHTMRGKRDEQDSRGPRRSWRAWSRRLSSPTLKRG
jgi:transposase